MGRCPDLSRLSWAPACPGVTTAARAAVRNKANWGERKQAVYRYKQSQFGGQASAGPLPAWSPGLSRQTKPIVGGFKFEVSRLKLRGRAPATWAFGLPASRRNALRRHYEHACAAPNKANLPGRQRPGLAKPGVLGTLCETKPIRRARTLALPGAIVRNKANFRGTAINDKRLEIKEL